jgi:glycosyltransferase involved in cell wall biosynthesis
MITVIIPSKGRSTLVKSLLSLVLQSNEAWECIVAYDGLPEHNKPIQDNRIQYIYLPEKTGDGKNGGGAVRNKAIDSCVSDWICFLDDDDSFEHEYINLFYEEINNNPDIDVCIFRMRYIDGKILPPQNCKELILAQVGISFAVKLQFLNKNNLRFKNSKIEDFNLLKSLENHGAKIHFSEHVVYNVGFSSI